MSFASRFRVTLCEQIFPRSNCQYGTFFHRAITTMYSPTMHFAACNLSESVPHMAPKNIPCFLVQRQKLSQQSKFVSHSDRVVFSGIQPTGVPHLGNYIGAIKKWVELQDSASDTNRVIYSVVDLHSITVSQQPADLRQNILATTISLLAAGLNPEKCVLFQQSRVSGHAELAWILGCHTSMTQLQTMTQWKDKKAKQKNRSAMLGLLSYPVLMSADILLYQATHVPVGDDQRQHLELARATVDNFNTAVGELVFPKPEPIIGDAAARVMSLKNPTSKMSKSDPSEHSRINISDTRDNVYQKIRKAVTDSMGTITYDRTERPAVANLIDMYAVLDECTPDEVVRQFDGLNTLEFKTALATVISDHLDPIQAEYTRLDGDHGYVRQILDNGAKQANAIASDTLCTVHRAVGFTV